MLEQLSKPITVLAYNLRDTAFMQLGREALTHIRHIDSRKR
jgi:hypothetical protein